MVPIYANPFPAGNHAIGSCGVAGIQSAARGGRTLPVAADRQTVLLAVDGVNVLSVTDGVARQVRQGAAPAPSLPAQNVESHGAAALAAAGSQAGAAPQG
jgi:hypothetical protein